MSEESEKLNKELETKMKLLKFTRDKTTGLLADSNILAMERQVKALNAIVDEVDSLRRKIEQFKFGNDESQGEIEAWGKEIDEEIGNTDKAMTRLTSAINEVRSIQLVKAKEHEHVLREKEREDQLKFEKRQYEQKLEFEKKLEENSTAKGQLVNQNCLKLSFIPNFLSLKSPNSTAT